MTLGAWKCHGIEAYFGGYILRVSSRVELHVVSQKPEFEPILSSQVKSDESIRTALAPATMRLGAPSRRSLGEFNAVTTSLFCYDAHALWAEFRMQFHMRFRKCKPMRMRLMDNCVGNSRESAKDN